jgi:hypothetical protein
MGGCANISLKMDLVVQDTGAMFNTFLQIRGGGWGLDKELNFWLSSDNTHAHSTLWFTLFKKTVPY